MVALVVLLVIGLAGSPVALANPVSDENARAGDSAWQQSTPAPESSIDGYASETSLAPGDQLHLHVAAPAGRYRIEISRLGYYGGAGGRRVTCIPGCSGDKPSASQPASGTPNPTTGFLDAGWSVTDTFTVPPDWATGMYIAALTLTTGPDAGKTTDVSFVVRPPAGAAPSQILVLIPVNTPVAYNGWGGKSLYGFNSTNGIPANHVSFNRPLLAESGAWYTEYPLIRYLEAQGFDVSYVTDPDVDANPSSLLSHRLVMTSGHGEYWTKNMRDGFDAARDAGVNLAFMGANTGYWQVRYEDNGRTIVAYKENAANDPNQNEVTTRFDMLNPPRPECALEGVHFADDDRGDEANRAYSVPSAAVSDPWMAGTGFAAGDTLPWLVGYEWDHVRFGCIYQGPTVLFHWQDSVSNADATRYTAGSGARVFASGSMQFVWGLGGHGWGSFAPHGAQVAPDPRLVRFMSNGMDDLTRPAPPTSVQAAVDSPNQVSVSVARHADAQAPTVRVYRHNGPGAFSVGDPGVRLACETTGTQCDAHGVPGHSQQRFAAVIVDRFGESQPVLAAPVSVPNSAPAISLAGNSDPTSMDADSFTATAQDPDGDSVGFTWTVDGVTQPETGPSLTRAFAAPGHHDVAVSGDDGHGGAAGATLGVDVAARPPAAQATAGPPAAGANRPPTARISGPTAFPTLRSERFDSRHSSDPEGSPLRYEWRLDRRVVGHSSGVSVRLTAPGTHRLELAVRDAEGATSTTALDLHAANRPPLLVAVAPTRLPPDRLGAFAARGLDPDGRLRGLAWNLPGFARPVTATDLWRRLAAGVTGFAQVRPAPGGLPALRLPLRTVADATGRSVLVAGALVPRSGPTGVTIDRRTCAGGSCRYARVRRVTVRTSPDGRFSLRYTAPQAGTYRFTVSAAPPPGDPRFSLAVPTRIGLLDRG